MVEGTRSHRAVVIGAGVSGLTTALCLRREGYDVTVVAEKFAPDVVSVVAGALWEWPPAVCGHHQDERSLERSKSWCMTSYETFFELAQRDDTGVFVRPAVFYFRHPVEDDPKDFRKMSELQDRVRGFVHDSALIEANGVSAESGVVDAYSHLAPMVDTDVYMRWLLDQVRESGCDVVCRKVEGSLADCEHQLLAELDADLLVNCSGLGAKDLAGDEMHPLRGALVRVHNDGHAMPRITEAHCVSHDPASGSQGMVFILPRGDDMLVLGGLVEADEWDVDIDLENYGPIRDMLRRCEEFLPALRHAELDVHEPVRVGLRPFRRQNVRVEHEAGTRIVHNYGHGGSGVTFSWGCAAEVVALAAQLLLADATVSSTPVPAQHVVPIERRHLATLDVTAIGHQSRRTAPVELRSDTMTRPTEPMRRAMYEAEVGDDCYGEDPTVRRLEERCAELFGTQAAVFTSSGTMSNLLAVRSHTRPGDDVVIDASYHISYFESAPTVDVCGVTLTTVGSPDGVLTPELVQSALDSRVRGPLYSAARLVCVENTVNFHSGRVVPVAALAELRAMTRARGLATHLDGARLLNACVASGTSPSEFAATADSVSMCFSKGLGAPFGSVLVGSQDFVEKARVHRQWLGGGLRQSGIMAAAALYALDHHVERLEEDHANASLLADELACSPFLGVPPAPNTNIVVIDVAPTGVAADAFVAAAERAGVRLLAWTPTSVRAVTGIGVTRDDVLVAARAIASVAGTIARRAA